MAVGQIPWNKGKKCPYLIGNKNGFKKGQPSWNKGTKGIMKSNQTTFNKGCISLFKGNSQSPEVKNRLRGLFKDKSWSQTRRKAQPEKKPKLLNGVKYHPFWDEIRRLVYKRDKYKCQECGKHGKMNAHHIDYDRENNDLSNLISLCTSCHAKTNYKRLDWIIYFNSKGKKSWQ